MSIELQFNNRSLIVEDFVARPVLPEDWSTVPVFETERDRLYAAEDHIEHYYFGRGYDGYRLWNLLETQANTNSLFVAAPDTSRIINRIMRERVGNGPPTEPDMYVFSYDNKDKDNLDLELTALIEIGVNTIGFEPKLLKYSKLTQELKDNDRNRGYELSNLVGNALFYKKYRNVNFAISKNLTLYFITANAYSIKQTVSSWRKRNSDPELPFNVYVTGADILPNDLKQRVC